MPQKITESKKYAAYFYKKCHKKSASHAIKAQKPQEVSKSIKYATNYN